MAGSRLLERFAGLILLALFLPIMMEIFVILKMFSTGEPIVKEEVSVGAKIHQFCIPRGGGDFTKRVERWLMPFKNFPCLFDVVFGSVRLSQALKLIGLAL